VGGSPTDSRHEKRIGSAGRGASACGHSCCEVAAQVEVHVCIAVGGSPTDSRHEKRSGSAGRGAGVGIVVYAFATGSGHESRRTKSRAGRVAGVGIGVGLRQLPVVGTKSPVPAQAEVQVHDVCILMGGLQITGTKSEVARR